MELPSDPFEELRVHRTSSATTEDDGNINVTRYVGLTYAALDVTDIVKRVRSPRAGAIIIFLGTTRDNVKGEPVRQLTYTAYAAKALRTLATLADNVISEHGLQGCAVVHRLGTVPVGEESIVIAVSAAHRQEAWRAAEEALETCKQKVEIWKQEELAAGTKIWRANDQ